MLKTAVIGVGAMGRNHVRVYAEMPNVSLVGVADASPPAAEAVGQKFGVPAFTDIRDLLEETRPEAVSIAVPTALHEEAARMALEAGAHVLVEKPIAATLEQGERLIAMAAERERKLMVGHIVRFNPALQMLKQKLEAGELGRIFQIVCRRSGPFPARIRDVGVVVDLAPHDLDVMRFLTGSEPTRLYAEIERRVHTDHEDLLLGLVRFGNGVIGHLEINWLTPTKMREVLVLGERGMFRVDDLTQDLYFFENAETEGDLWGALQAIKGVSEGRMVRYAVARQEPLKLELQAFVEAVLNDRPVPVGGEDGLQALRLALMLIESGQKNEAVTV
ncbi:MAG: Gfo/Idh/MocA family oxidoreductase [Chloroflexi bacterium]|nr:Gfo/Idh/MocA family oxidoreductase [Chloroflexota bacterium]